MSGYQKSNHRINSKVNPYALALTVLFLLQFLIIFMESAKRLSTGDFFRSLSCGWDSAKTKRIALSYYSNSAQIYYNEPLIRNLSYFRGSGGNCPQKCNEFKMLILALICYLFVVSVVVVSLQMAPSDNRSRDKHQSFDCDVPEPPSLLACRRNQTI